MFKKNRSKDPSINIEGNKFNIDDVKNRKWFLQSVIYNFDTYKNGYPKKSEINNAIKYLKDHNLWDEKSLELPNGQRIAAEHSGHFRDKKYIEKFGDLGKLDITKNYFRFRQFNPDILYKYVSKNNLKMKVITKESSENPKVKYVFFIV